MRAPIVHGGLTGLLIEGRSAEALAMAVRRVVEDVELRKYLVENARRRVASQFSEQQMLRKIQKVYERFNTELRF